MAPSLAYISFDVVPAPKGAAVHIEAFVRAIAQRFGSIQLVTVSPDADCHAMGDRWPGVHHLQLPARGKTLLERVLYFRRQLQAWLAQDAPSFDIIHFRSIYEGFPLVQASPPQTQFIFEVNGLPSIELKYRYPKVADDWELMIKLRSQEQYCLEAAHQILTPSPVTARHLQQRGIPASKIQVIPNGVHLDRFTYQAPRLDPNLDPLNLLYCGTLSPWQGVGQAVDALHLYRRDYPATLTIIGPGKPSQIKTLEKLAEKLDISESLQILPPVSQTELVQHLHRADAILAPLMPNDRNCIQGCCPLKVLEGMASGTPVITSRLAVVESLGEHETQFLTVRPGSAKSIKDALVRLRAEPQLRSRLSTGGRSRIETAFTWEQAGRSLIAAYEQRLTSQPSNSASKPSQSKPSHSKPSQPEQSKAQRDRAGLSPSHAENQTH